MKVIRFASPQHLDARALPATLIEKLQRLNGDQLAILELIAAGMLKGGV